MDPGLHPLRSDGGQHQASRHTLTIGPCADIKAEIFAKAVIVMGAVSGNVTAGEKVEILAAGSVIGDISSPRLAITDGGRLCGRVEMPPGAVGPTRPTLANDRL